MDPKEARKIAYHHLGDALVILTGGAGSWYVVARPDPSRPSVIDTGSTVAEAAADCASQLRAGGWVPTHPRLEWESTKWQHHLVFLMDSFRVELFFVYHSAKGWTVWRRHDTSTDVAVVHRVPVAAAAAAVAAWHAANLPSLHLPPFPGASDAV